MPVDASCSNAFLLPLINNEILPFLKYRTETKTQPFSPKQSPLSPCLRLYNHKQHVLAVDRSSSNSSSPIKPAIRFHRRNSNCEYLSQISCRADYKPISLAEHHHNWTTGRVCGTKRALRAWHWYYHQKASYSESL